MTSLTATMFFLNLQDISGNIDQKLIVKANNGSNFSLGGEIPIRISDLLRQGKLMRIIRQRNRQRYYEIDTDGDIDEERAEEYLRDFDDPMVELHIDEDEIDDWRNHKGIPTVYGRIADAGERYKALQYWMYYPGSTLPEGNDGKRNRLWHEGDVEFFQVLLEIPNPRSASGGTKIRPIGVSSGQHYYGESKHWNEIKRDDDQPDRPIVHIAFGSHATHFSSKDAKTGPGNFGFLARENNAVSSPKVDELNFDAIEIVPALIEKPSDSKIFDWQVDVSVDGLWTLV